MYIMKNVLILFVVCSAFVQLFSQTKANFQIARLKYSGGSDWYNGQTEEPNLLNFIKDKTNLKVDAEFTSADIATNEIFSYPFLFMTGHGNVVFSDEEIQRLRKYLEAGGFLYVDDDYGLDKSFRREIKKIFPNKNLTELPFSYGLFHIFYDFPNGTPKIQLHNGKPPQAFGIFINKRLAVLYTYESNPSDGWDDPQVHDKSPAKREEALKFGTNIVLWALSQ